ncbi:hypothetical protein BDZ91DRAFT_344101 [Kalaharituber pfeilii]|nr:hypothetical protein BDZ91DRAFT_344101 [Kalaharituber pfeilii]
MQELERKDSLKAIRQGKEFNVGLDKPPEEMMEEAEFVQALTDLTFSPVEDITEASGMEFMDVGDLVELRTIGGNSELGIFIQPPLEKNGNFLFLTETGRLKTWLTTGMVFTIPKFAPVESAELLRKYLAQLSDESVMVDPPRQLTKPLTDKIREFHTKSLTVFSKKLPILETLYDRFSHPTETRLLTTFEAAKAIFPDGYTNHQVYAVHLALMDDPRHFIADMSRYHKKSAQFEVRSREHLEILNKVTGWLRRQSVTLATGKVVKQHTDVIQSFARKAAALVDKSREFRGDQLLLFRPAEAVPMKEFAWDENDKAIIQFLKFALDKYWFQQSPVAALYPQILKATGKYKEEWRLDMDLLFIFLMEIGVYRPWENNYRFSPRYPLPYHGVSGEADMLANKVAEVNRDVETTWQKLGFKDKVASIREDINEPIYAIDDASAEEIDDGISFTPISDAESWVHVHVANPTAFLQPDHWITEMAKNKVSTLYLPEKTFPMIPRGLVDYGFGLRTGSPTLTISVRLDTKTGEINDYKIRYGIAKNLKRVTYSQFNKILGFQAPKGFSLVVNPPRDAAGNVIEPNEESPEVPLDESEVKVFTQLRAIALALKKKRVAAGSMSFINLGFRISVNDHPHDPQSENQVHINPDFPVLYKGLPTLTFTRDMGPTPAHETVAEFMLLGGTVASHFLSKHKIPAPYRGHSLSPRKGTEHIWENILLPKRNELGLIDKSIIREHFTVLGSSSLSPTPLSHRLLGLNVDLETGIGGYIKATSPLRRYLDMVVHFQIEKVIMNLAAGLPANTNLPYSEQYLARELPITMNMERRIRSIQQSSEKFWVWKLIRWGTLESRIVPAREHLMPKTYHMELTSKNEWPSPGMGMLQEFCVPMKFWFISEEIWKEAEWGSIGEVIVDESLWSRIKVNMRWQRNAPKAEAAA